MPSYLSIPVLEKLSEDLEDERLMSGSSTMQGWRQRQEVNDVSLILHGWNVNNLLFYFTTRKRFEYFLLSIAFCLTQLRQRRLKTIAW